MNLIVCLSLLGYCLTLTRFSKWPVEYTPFFIISTVITLLYCFAYWGFLKSGADAILILGGFLFLASPIFLLQQKNQLWEKYFTPGWVISICFLTLFLLFAHNVHFLNWDEFTHWGPHDKLVYIHNGFINASDITVHKSYPLGGALFHYLFFRPSGFSESTAYVAQCLLIMTPLFILVSGFGWSSWKKVFAAFTATILLLISMGVKMGPVDTLYMDNAVGIYTGMCVIAYLASPKKLFNIFYLIPSIIALTLFKQKLFPFVLMITIIIFADQILSLNRNKNNTKYFILNLLALVTLPTVSYLTTKSWHHYLSLMHTPIEWKMNLTLEKIKGAFSAPADSFSSAVIKNYIGALSGTLFFIVAMLALNGIAYYYSKNQKMIVLVTNAILLLGFIAYITALLLMYLFSFGGYESIVHASMNRYLSIYEISWLLITLYFLFNAILCRNSKNSYIENSCAALAFIAVLALIAVHFVKQNQLIRQPDGVLKLRQSITTITNAVARITKPRDKIFTIWQSSAGLEDAITRYQLIPRKPNPGCTSFGGLNAPGDIWTCRINKKQLQQRFSTYHYLLLAYVDNNFWSHYGALIPHGQNAKPLITYTICHGNNFNSFGKPGCRMKTYHAYLFKIKSGKLYGLS